MLERTDKRKFADVLRRLKMDRLFHGIRCGHIAFQELAFQAVLFLQLIYDIIV